VVLSAAGKAPLSERLNRLYNVDTRGRDELAVLADLDAIRGTSPEAYRRVRGVIGDLAMNARRKKAVQGRRRGSK